MELSFITDESFIIRRMKHRLDMNKTKYIISSFFIFLATVNICLYGIWLFQNKHYVFFIFCLAFLLCIIWLIGDTIYSLCTGSLSFLSHKMLCAQYHIPIKEIDKLHIYYCFDDDKYIVLANDKSILKQRQYASIKSIYITNDYISDTTSLYIERSCISTEQFSDLVRFITSHFPATVIHQS